MKNIIEHHTSDNDLVYRINRKTKKGIYNITAADRRGDILNNPIRLEGFDRLPTGFYKEGYGLTTAGNLVVQEIHRRYKKMIDLTVTASGAARIDARGKTVSLVLPHKQLTKVGESVRTIKRERNEEMRIEVQHFLGDTYNQFKDLKDTEAGYSAGRLSELLGQDKVLSNLSAEDREALEEFIPEYLSNIPGTLKAKKKLQVIFDALDAGKKIYLEKVLREFRSKLKRNVQNEHSWQKFLSDYILILRQSYGEVLEKESVSLQGKFPDFMLIDPYGYLDIYEIKKPSTQLLRHDASRNNYYWDTEISKAIAQIENYTYQAQRHADALATDIRKAKNLDVNIVRPRGYIIAGRRSQLSSPKMKDDFRILSESLKNVDIILYDDLLESLEAFVARTGSASQAEAE